MAPTIPKICGVKRSIFCTLVSTWGIVMLAAMGGLLSYKSLAFVEDVAVDDFDQHHGIDVFYSEQDQKYDVAASNCYMAAALYAGTLVISVYHWYVYQKRGLV